MPKPDARLAPRPDRSDDATAARRRFLKALVALSGAVAAGASGALAGAGPAAEPAGEPVGDPGSSAGWPGAGPRDRDRLGDRLPERRLGRTGEFVSTLGVGGSHVIMQDHTEAQSQAIIEAALDEGVRFFDTAQQYGDGLSERRFGQFLTPKYRDVVYLMTKTQATERTQALRDMDACRKRLNVDVIDLMQIHHIESPDHVDRRIDGGVVDVLLEAQAAGKIRHLGFTGHDTPAAHLRMFERLDAQGVSFDTVQMPVNVVDPGYESFITRVLPECLKRDCGVLAMKTLAHGQFAGTPSTWGFEGRKLSRLVPEQMSVAEALGFVWSLPVSCLISGMDRPELVRENAELARSFVPLDEERSAELVRLGGEIAGRQTEFYKTEPWAGGGAG